MPRSRSARPPRSRRALGPGLAFAAAVGLGGCSDDQSARDSADGAKKLDKAAAKTPSRDSGKKPAEKAEKAAECCRYCFEKTPCGDECIETSKTCSAEAPGCACAWDKRPPPKFRGGDKTAKLIAPDVPAYNKAQGDPIDGLFTLEKAFEGDEKLANREGGTLRAVFSTTMGKIDCELFEAGAPLTVANFVGLARGKRPYRDPKAKEWKTGPFFDGILFHRVIDGFMVQTGDPLGTGTGGPGYFVPDEFDPSLRHNKPGILSMANRNVNRTGELDIDPQTGLHVGNTGSSQFFITVKETPHLDGKHTVFGQCDPEVPLAISKVEVRTNRALGEDHKPVKEVKIDGIEFARRKGK